MSLPPQSPYTDAFFQLLRHGSQRSAARVVPFVVSLVAPKSVVDVGCGVGTWLKAFKDTGVETVLGIDGHYVAASGMEISHSEFHPHDLLQPLQISRRFDLAVSLEVAEHLPPEAADDFVGLLASLAPCVLFSAAIPGQGGTDHLNEQWPDYWARKFAANGFRCHDAIRLQFWNDSEVEPWYAQNTFIFAQPEVALADTPPGFPLEESGEPVSLVHPGVLQRLADWADHLESRLCSLEGVTTRQLLARLPAALRESARWRLEHRKVS